MPFILRAIRAIMPVIELVPPLARKFATKVFFTPVKFRYPQVEREYLKKAVKEFIDLDGRKIQVYKWGEGKPIIMVHGWSGRATQFWKFIKPFNENGFQVISFDGPAHGFSEGKSTNVVEFAAVIDVLRAKYRTSVLIGHSLGGVSSLISAKNPDGLEKIIMIGSPSIAEEVLNDFLRRIKAGKATGQGIPDYVHKLTGEKFEHFMSLKVLEHVKDVEVSLIHDTDDNEVSIDHAYAIINKFPDIELYETKGLGHTRILKNEEVIDHSMSIITSRKNKRHKETITY